MSATHPRSLGSLAALSLLLAACGGSSSGGGSNGGGGSPACDGFDCQAMVDNLGNDVMAATFGQFDTRAKALETAVDAYAGAPEDMALRNDARSAWREAMATWQRAELMEVGPLLDNGSQLRDAIYSWPATSSCDVDQEVLAARADDYQLDDSVSPRRRGLDALGYLLFRDDFDDTCAPQIGIDSEWGALDPAERRAASAGYAADVAGDLADRAGTLTSEWQGFLDELENPGSSGSRFDSVEQAINALSDALFYLEKDTNDTKLAAPTGFTGESCNGAGQICLDDIESPHAEVSRENIIHNLEGFRLMFLGEQGQANGGEPGFYEFLAAQSADGENVASTMLSDLNAAQTQLEGIDLTLTAALQDSTALSELQVAYDSLSEVNKQLKDQFLRILGLTIPDAAAGDGD